MELTLHEGACSLYGIGVGPDHFQDLQGVSDRGHWVSQFVPDDPEETENFVAGGGLRHVLRVGRFARGLACGVSCHARRNSIVEEDTQRHHLPRRKRPSELGVQVFENDEAQELVVAHDLFDRPAGFPPLFAVNVRRPTVAERFLPLGVGKPAAKFPEKRRQVVEEDIMMNALGGGLFLDRPLHHRWTMVPASRRMTVPTVLCASEWRAAGLVFICFLTVKLCGQAWSRVSGTGRTCG